VGNRVGIGRGPGNQQEGEGVPQPGQEGKGLTNVEVRGEPIHFLIVHLPVVYCWSNEWRGGTGLSIGPSSRAVPGCLATAKAGYRCRKEEERSRGCRQGSRVGGTTHWPAQCAPTRLCRGGGDFGLPEGPPSHRGQAQSQQDGLVRIGRFDGTCHLAPGPLSGTGSAPLPAQEKGSSAQGPVETHRFQERKSRGQRPATELRWCWRSQCRGTGRATG
jgi:hypothetical protein